MGIVFEEMSSLPPLLWHIRMKDRDYIVDQKYAKQIYREFYYDGFKY